MNTRDKLHQLENLYVASPRIKAILEEIESCRVDSKSACEPRSMLLIGETGAGKTTIIKKYLEEFPAYETGERRIIPVFKSELPSRVTPKAVAQTMLTEMCSEDPGSGDQVSLTNRLARLIKETQVELIILDEFQHLLKPESIKYMQNVSDWIKTLLNKIKIPILLVGTPNAETILFSNSQLERRFSVVEELKYYSWTENPKEYRMFLKMVDRGLPFDEPANLQDPHRAIRFFAASGGMPGLTMLLILEAGRKAIKNGLPGLTDGLFADVFNKHMLRKSKLKLNPWLLGSDDLEAYIDNQAKQETSLKHTRVKASVAGSSLAGGTP